MSEIGEDHALDALIDMFDPTDLVISIWRDHQAPTAMPVPRQQPIQWQSQWPDIQANPM